MPKRNAEEQKKHDLNLNAFMHKVAAQSWHEELAYCANLIATGGNASVPEASVSSYLHVQKVSATRAEMLAHARAFQLLAELWSLPR